MINWVDVVFEVVFLVLAAFLARASFCFRKHIEPVFKKPATIWFYGWLMFLVATIIDLADEFYAFLDVPGEALYIASFGLLIYSLLSFRKAGDKK